MVSYHGKIFVLLICMIFLVFLFYQRWEGMFHQFTNKLHTNLHQKERQSTEKATGKDYKIWDKVNSQKKSSKTTMGRDYKIWNKERPSRNSTTGQDYKIWDKNEIEVCTLRNITFPANSRKFPKKVKIHRIWCNSQYVKKYNLCLKSLSFDFKSERKKFETKIKTELFNAANVDLPDQKDKFSFVPNIKEYLTIVAAYIELIPFDRVGEQKPRGYDVYSRWASVFEYIVNPLVFYTESREFAMTMMKYRKKLISKTTIFLIQRRDLYSFNYFNKICSIFFQPDYPVMQGITESADYGCVMHSKSDIVADAVRRNIYNTPYYAWLDVGHFRDLVSEKKLFRLNVPHGFDNTKIAFSKLGFDYLLGFRILQIFRQSYRWIAGSMFLGKGEALLKYRALYKRSVEHFLSQNLSSSDEITITAIYSREGRRILKPEVDNQVFYDRKYHQTDRTFYLGHFCRTVL